MIAVSVFNILVLILLPHAKRVARGGVTRGVVAVVSLSACTFLVGVSPADAIPGLPMAYVVGALAAGDFFGLSVSCAVDVLATA